MPSVQRIVQKEFDQARNLFRRAAKIVGLVLSQRGSQINWHLRPNIQMHRPIFLSGINSEGKGKIPPILPHFWQCGYFAGYFYSSPIICHSISNLLIAFHEPYTLLGTRQFQDPEGKRSQVILLVRWWFSRGRLIRTLLDPIEGTSNPGWDVETNIKDFLMALKLSLERHTKIG